MSKKSPFFLFLIFLSGLSYAQPEIPQLLYSDFFQIPSDTSSTVFYTYKVPLNHLVFEKQANLFLAEYRISVEVFDSKNDKFITRAIKEKNIQVPDYEQTNSPLIFSEGILILYLKPGSYLMTEILYDYKSDREFKIPPYPVKIDSTIKYITPLITTDKTVDCSKRKSAVLANYGGKLPFDEELYSFIFPVKNPGTGTLFVNIIQDKDTLYHGRLTDPKKEKLTLSECGGKVALDENPDMEEYNIFRIDGVSSRIREGGFLIYISDTSEFSTREKFTVACKWINKPVSLRDPELAIKVLKIIEKDSVINSLLNADDEDYIRELAAYWKKIDPTPETEFNPLMQEFYSRIDYAVKNFTTIAGANGASTDRGKVYIRFGKPSDIDRTSDNYGNVIETWTYNNPQRKFVFVDKNGTGEFSLING
ncbi:MAG TPA: GWxTD domain-containing protein [Ignavibacteriaceae bacterium]|nr:GWxTD domain-containing protein [Ignavibacteriaceae bacterium]